MLLLSKNFSDKLKFCRFVCLISKMHQFSDMFLRNIASQRAALGLMQKRLASMLVNNPKYGFLKELGLTEECNGVFDGEWRGNGPLLESLCPANNEVIAKVRTGRCSFLTIKNSVLKLYING